MTHSRWARRASSGRCSHTRRPGTVVGVHCEPRRPPNVRPKTPERTTTRTGAYCQARELMAAITAQGGTFGVGVRVVEAAGGLGCLVLVWDAGRGMPRLSAERR